MATLDLKAIAARVLKPNRARVAETRTLVEGAASAQEAASRLAAHGFDPSAALAPWPESLRAPERIDCLACDGRGTAWAHSYDATPCPDCKGSGARGFLPSYVPSVDAVALLAADQEGRRVAELAALEAAKRLRIWDVPKVSRVVWRVEPELTSDLVSVFTYGALGWFVDRFSHAFELQPPLDVEALLDDARVHPRARLAFRDTVRIHLVWGEAVRRGLKFPSRKQEFDFGPAGTSRIDVPEGCAGKPLASLPDPVEPLLALWSTGYAPRAVEEGVVLLQAIGAE